MNLETVCTEVNALAKEVGAYIQSQKIAVSDVETKSKNSLVTFVDKTAEQKLVKRLSELIPEAGFIAEEGTSTKVGEVYNWIIDPLDGTTNFIHGVPCYCVSIGLTRNDKLVLGVIYEPNLDELFYSWEGSKAYLNGKEISVTSTLTLENSLIATGFPYYDYEKQDEYMNLFKDLMKNSRGLRRLGSAAVDLAYVACGRFDAFYEYSLHPWDVAAGSFIVQQAGGKVADFKGADDYLFGKEIITCNPHIYAELLEKVKLHFNYLN